MFSLLGYIVQNIVIAEILWHKFRATLPSPNSKSSSEALYDLLKLNKRKKLQSPVAVFDHLRFLWQETGCTYCTFFCIGDLKLHSPTKNAAGHPQQQINTSAWVHPPLFLEFSSLLPVIPLPHLSLSPLFTGDSSAAPLAKKLAEKAAGLHQLSHLLLTSYSQRWFHTSPLPFEIPIHFRW